MEYVTVADIFGNASVLTRLQSKVSPDGDCAIFTGASGRNGYGKIWDGERVDSAHRVAWRVHFGPIPAGMFVCHRCDRKLCVAPAHLFLGTCRDNLADMRAKQRHSRGREHGQRMSSAYTPEKRAALSQTRKEAAKDRLEAAAVAAGFPPDWKFCPECRTWKSRADFHRNAARRDGIKPYCKPCATHKDLDRRARKAA